MNLICIIHTACLIVFIGCGLTEPQLNQNATTLSHTQHTEPLAVQPTEIVRREESRGNKR